MKNLAPRTTECYPTNPVFLGNSRYLAHQGELFCSKGSYDIALNYFNQAIQIDPSYDWAIAHRGETYRLTGHYQAALADFNQSLSITPTYVWALAHRGVTYRFMGKAYYEWALADLNQAISLQPDYAWAIAYRCRVYDLLRRYEEALVDFDKAIVFDQTLFKDWQSERGLLLSHCGRYEEAIACCQQAVQINPSDHFAWYNIAVFKTRWQGWSSAQTDIEKARSTLSAALNTQDHGIILYRLSGLAALAGETESALNLLQQAISLDSEAIEFAPHDMAWLKLRNHPRFQALVSDP